MMFLQCYETKKKMDVSMHLRNQIADASNNVLFSGVTILISIRAATTY